jgi:hypothetical protein
MLHSTFSTRSPLKPERHFQCPTGADLAVRAKRNCSTEAICSKCIPSQACDKLSSFMV